MVKYEKVLSTSRPDLCVVLGDVNSTMACAITARKSGIRVAHVEGGLRSGDWSMPEEINRVVTDSVSNFFFTTSEYANENLIRSGVSPEAIHFVGNTMIDSLYLNLDRIKRPSFYDALGLSERSYFVLTLHRPTNVDSATQLAKLVNLIGGELREFPVIFPVHPRTKNILNEVMLSRKIPDNIVLQEPQPYLEFHFLVRNAKAVLTDSGGVTEEATVHGVPCVTLRDTTERPETVAEGTNELVGDDVGSLRSALNRIRGDCWKKGSIPKLWDGRASERILDTIESMILGV
jgi:UDP-N-acetylglucosamine 2-epimerase (non-hydrolysing)